MEQKEVGSVKKKTNTLAVVGFILAFIIPLIGLILMIVSLGQIKKRKEGGKGLAVAGVILASVFLLGQIIFVVAMVGGVKEVAKNNPSPTSSTNSSKTSTAQPTVKIGQVANDGKFAFTITSVECNHPNVGSDYTTKTAQGQYCLVNMTVKNIGNEAQMLDASSQYLYNAQNQKYTADSMASYAANPSGATFLENINPGNSVTGIFVFDLPKGVTPTIAELHDSPFSGGVKINLQ